MTRPLPELSVLPVPTDLDGLTTAELIVARVRAHVWRRLLWLQHLWQGPVAPDHWVWLEHERDKRDDEKVFYHTKPAKPLRDAIAAVDGRLKGDAGNYRARLAALFSLKDEERDALDLAFALDADTALAAQCAAVFPDGPHLPSTETLVRQLFGYRDLPQAVLRPNSGLIVWRLLNETAPEHYRIDRTVAAYINGALSLDEGLALIARVHAASDLVTFPSAPAEQARLVPMLERQYKLRVRIDGRAVDRPLDFAAAVAQGLGLRLLSLNLTGQAEAADLMLRAERLALLGGFALHVEGLDWARYPVGLSGAPLIFAVAHGADPLPPVEGRVDWMIVLPPPTPAAKLAFCQRLQKAGTGKGLKREALARLCASPGLGYDDLHDLLGQSPASLDEARDALRRRLAARSGETGHVLVPQRGWDDIVLAADTLNRLKQIVFEARARSRYGDHPHKTPLDYLRAGMPVMLHGAPGTGKTLAAEIMAGESGRNLHVADLAGLISKYVGETAQNLKKLFDEARRSGDVLFIDEADSLFTKRTEVRDSNDKHANADANYLLQLIESHPGFTLLATNRPADIDPAFFRRMRFNVEIGRPVAAERLRMWRKTVTELTRRPQAAFDDLLRDFSESLDMTPAQIKNAAVSAYFRALQDGSRIRRQHLIDGVAYELAKEGRVLNERDARRFTRPVIVPGLETPHELEKRGA